MELRTFFALLTTIWTAQATVHFKEEFAGGDWKSRWISSTSKGDEQGVFELSHGDFFGDAEKDLGLQTSQDARFYGISTKFPAFSNEGKTLVIQFSVKHQQEIDCGGGYVKVFGSDLEPSELKGDTSYHIMFGPDICGSDKRIHVIFNYKGNTHLLKKEIDPKTDVFTHVYTLVVKPDNTYMVKVDGEVAQQGSLEEDWDLLKPKEIEDPEQSKPADWVEDPEIPDPNDKKPEDWDKPQHIPDPDATKPADWDDEMDGEWEPSSIDNPEYKGDWAPKNIPNPAYKGPWVHPKIPNPEYVPDETLYKYDDIAAIGLDLWQVKSGSIFDNIFVGDDEAEADEFRKATFDVTKEGEKKMKEELDEEKRKQEEAENPNAEPEKEEEADDEDDVDEEGEEVTSETSTETPTSEEHDEL